MSEEKYEQPYSQYTQTVVEAQGDKIEEWELFWALGKRMGLEMSLASGPIDMVNKPSKLDLLRNITKGSRVPVEQIAANEGGNIYDVEDVILGAPDPETQGRLDFYPEGLSDEFAAAMKDTQTSASIGANGEYSHLFPSHQYSRSPP